MHHGVIYDMIQGEEWNVAIARGTKGGYEDMMISASLTDCVFENKLNKCVAKGQRGEIYGILLWNQHNSYAKSIQ